MGIFKMFRGDGGPPYGDSAFYNTWWYLSKLWARLHQIDKEWVRLGLGLAAKRAPATGVLSEVVKQNLKDIYQEEVE